MSTMFDPVFGGNGVMPDSEDNPDHHMATYHETGTRIIYKPLDVGDFGNNARAGTEIDNTFVTEWESQYLDPDQSKADLISLRPLSAGLHTRLNYVNTGSGQSDHSNNIFDVE